MAERQARDGPRQVQLDYAFDRLRASKLAHAYEMLVPARARALEVPVKERAQYKMHMYPGTQHGFHNNSTPRYHEASAKLAWDRTIAFFKKHLA